MELVFESVGGSGSGVVVFEFSVVQQKAVVVVQLKVEVVQV